MNALSSSQLPESGSSAGVPLCTGREVDLFRLSADQVEAHDIAQALAAQAFHPGMTEVFYSTAQHSIEVARRVPQRYRLAALLQRAPAAYMGDMTRIRDLFPELRHFEEHVRRVIHRRFGLVDSMSPEAIELIAETEAQVIAIEEEEIFIRPGPEEGGEPPPALRVTQIRPLSGARAAQAYKAFLVVEAR